MGSVVNDSFCLKWHDFHTSVTSSFSELRKDPDLLDATVVCEGQTVRAHKLVLSACSNVFRQLFRTSLNSVEQGSLQFAPLSQHPVILMFDVKAEDMKLVFNFMYEGQVNVAQERLSAFLALAERLQVRGLTTMAGDDMNNRAVPLASAAAVKTMVPFVPPSVQIPVLGAAADVASSRRQQQLMPTVGSALHLHGVHPPKRSKTLTTVNIGDQRSEDAHAANVKHELNEQSLYNGSRSVVSAGIGSTGTANSVQPGGFHPSEASVTASFNAYNYGTTASSEVENATVAVSAPFGDGAIVAPASVSHPVPSFELQPTLIASDERKASVIVSSGVGASVANSTAVAVAASEQPASTAVSPTKENKTSSNDELALGTAGCNNSNRDSLIRNRHSQPPNNSGVCHICNKAFRQLRSHIQDVHNPTPTPCPLCGKIFTSRHKMFGHKYRSCPNRTKNLVRHLQDIASPSIIDGDLQHQVATGPQDHTELSPF